MVEVANSLELVLNSLPFREIIGKTREKPEKYYFNDLYRLGIRSNKIRFDF